MRSTLFAEISAPIIHVQQRVLRGITYLNKERPALLNYFRANHSKADFNNMSLQVCRRSSKKYFQLPHAEAKEKILLRHIL